MLLKVLKQRHNTDSFVFEKFITDAKRKINRVGENRVEALTY